MKFPKYHFFVFSLGIFGLLVISQLAKSFPLFWALVGWGATIIVHLMYTISSEVQDDWADKRADDLVDNAYDIDHIESIRSRKISNKKRNSPIGIVNPNGIGDPDLK